MKKKLLIILIIPVLVLVFFYGYFYLRFELRLDDRVSLIRESIRYKKSQEEFNLIVSKVLSDESYMCMKEQSTRTIAIGLHNVVITCIPNKDKSEFSRYVIFPSWWQNMAGSLGGCAAGIYWTDGENIIYTQSSLGIDIGGFPLVKKIKENWYAFSYISVMSSECKYNHRVN